MQIIENNIVKEKIYIEKFENGLTIMLMPKKEIQKKFFICVTKCGSIDSKFIVPNEVEETSVPDGIAHFLEHKLFEQKNGTNSLDTLSALGANPNAYTTADHTAYHIEPTANLEESLDEFMDYIQNPYFTDENVEKEKGIIGQEITMYDDHPSWQVYLNALKCLYKENHINIDTAGTVQTISHINKDVLYKCYNTFYHPSNMVIFAVGDFVPEEILEEIKKRLIPKENMGEIKRIYPEEPKTVNKKRIEKNMDISIPLFILAFKDDIPNENIVKRHIAIEILLNMLIGKSSKLYKKLYEEELIMQEPLLEYDFAKSYAHIAITGQSKNPKKILEEFKKEVEKYIKDGINRNDFKRIKNMIYGNYVKEFNNVSDICRMFVSDFFKGINSFEYIEESSNINLEYVEDVLNRVFKEENTIISIVKNK